MNPVTQPSAKSNVEAKIAREVVCVAKATKPEKDEFDSFFERRTLCRTLWGLAWVNRFISNSRRHEKRSGPLTTEETETAKIWWIKRIQNRDATEPHYEETCSHLGLQSDERGVTVCMRKIRGNYPIYLSRDAEFAEKLGQRIHSETLHGGLGLTTAAVIGRY